MSPRNDAGRRDRQTGARAALPARPGQRARLSALFVVALLLSGSGAIRIGTGLSFALAEQNPSEQGPPSSGTQQCDAAQAAGPLLEALKAREATIVEQEGRIADRESALKLADIRIGARMAELKGAEDKLSETLAMAESAADQDVAQLVSVYESMKAKEAAPLFQQMDAEFAAGFLSRMRPESAAAIMAGIDPKQAYLISVVLAGRNAGAPKT